MRALALSVALLACSGSRTSDGTCSFPPGLSGEATTYSGTSAGACSFPAGRTLYAAVAPSAFAGSAACGACLEVTGPAATATVEVVDLCPECAATQLDLSPGAWDAVTGSAPPGVATVTYREVPCPEAGPVRFVASTGVNPWWMAVVVEDHRYPIAAVEMLPAGATAWIPLARSTWNGWIGTAAGDGVAAPVQLRATDVFGQATATTVSMPTIAAGAEATAPQLGDTCG